MTEPNVFSKKNIALAAAGTGRGLLEELNLPPQVIAFIRKNKKQLQIAGVCLVVAALAYVFFDYYTEARRDEAAALLVTALKEEQVEKRYQALEALNADYHRTTSAVWGRLEMANMDYQAGKYEEALQKYEELLKGQAADNPLTPLLQYSIALTSEMKQDYDKALASYQILLKTAGYKVEGALGVGGIHEMRGQVADAKSVYEEYLASSEVQAGSATEALVLERLARVKENGASAAEQDKN
ncbi:MAG: hypothetical protein A2521_06650 [Deltaproteobacteria bacterium RIFOXYD12_FULL_57_12]|nr:MAG: hypothetical protein A2521_06650 [Deltaproteobacteria bacterium RIFOXYD12_FULL_57_12]